MTSQDNAKSAQPMTLEAARDEGLLIDLIPLAQIDAAYLMRDRLEPDEDEMASLISSLQSRGQQMPIEVTTLPEGRYGLISGWRRLTAMRQIHAQTKDARFARIRAMIIQPQTAQSAYLAMIEENEIRVNLSHYERARIAVRAVQEGIFPDQRAALRGLYSSVTRSKRSKIGTFMSLVDAFDGVLQHPTAIPEKLGLSLARELIRDRGFGDRLSAELRRAPSRTAPEEARILQHAVITAQDVPDPKEPKARITPKPPKPAEIRHETIERVEVRFNPTLGRVDIVGDHIDAAFFDDLRAWLAERLR